jgi:hypothetical protein
MKRSGFRAYTAILCGLALGGCATNYKSADEAHKHDEVLSSVFATAPDGSKILIGYKNKEATTDTLLVRSDAGIGAAVTTTNSTGAGIDIAKTALAAAAEIVTFGVAGAGAGGSSGSSSSVTIGTYNDNSKNTTKIADQNNCYTVAEAHSAANGCTNDTTAAATDTRGATVGSMKVGNGLAVLGQ